MAPFKGAFFKRLTGDPMTDLQNAPFLKGLKYKEQQVRAPREGTHPHVLEFARKFIERAAKYDIPLFAHEFWREGARQNKLHAQGFSKARAGESAHNHGLAVDIIHGTRGWMDDVPEEVSREHWAIVGALGLETARSMNLELNWGGNEKDLRFPFRNESDTFRWDPAHWEVKDWRNRVDSDAPETFWGLPSQKEEWDRRNAGGCDTS